MSDDWELRAWQEHEDAECAAQQMRIWNGAAHQLQQILAALRPAGDRIEVLHTRECGQLGCRAGEHAEGHIALTREQLAAAAQAEIDRAGRAAGRVQQQHDRRIAESRKDERSKP